MLKIVIQGKIGAVKAVLVDADSGSNYYGSVLLGIGATTAEAKVQAATLQEAKIFLSAVTPKK